MVMACKPHATDAWIAPDGRFFPVADCKHSAVAAVIMAENLGRHDVPYPGDVLEKMGYIHLTFGHIRAEEYPTQAQLDALWDVLVAYQTTGDRYKAEALRVDMSDFLGGPNL
jgi:hypothetical protein